MFNSYIFPAKITNYLRIFCILPAITTPAITLPDYRVVNRYYLQMSYVDTTSRSQHRWEAKGIKSQQRLFLWSRTIRSQDI